MASSLLSPENLENYLNDIHPEWACSGLKPLSGGVANLTCRGTLTSDNTSIIIKHAEELSGDGWSFPASRARDEELLLSKLHTDQVCVHESYGVKVGTPKLLAYLDDSHTQIIEDVEAADLKTFLLSNSIDDSSAWAIGQAIGKWLRRFHEWGRSPDQAELTQILEQNENVLFKHTINYGRLENALHAYPDLYEVLREYLPIITEFSIPDDEVFGIVHGDFWCGNILLSNSFTEEGANLWGLNVIDFEIAQVSLPSADLGQMLAELYLLYHFASRPEALEMLSSILASYGTSTLSDDEKYRVVMNFGVHLIVWPPFTPSWKSCGNDKMKECVRFGVGTVGVAFNRSREPRFWSRHPLGQLFT